MVCTLSACRPGGPGKRPEPLGYLMSPASFEGAHRIPYPLPFMNVFVRFDLNELLDFGNMDRYRKHNI